MTNDNKMKALLYYEPGVVKFEEIDIPEPAPDEVLVKVNTALTCGTDIKTYKRGHPVLIKDVPSGFGHEFAGTIAKIGNNVEGFSIGDRVEEQIQLPVLSAIIARLKNTIFVKI
jgi:L-iditol 2-dehydrogenase